MSFTGECCSVIMCVSLHGARLSVSTGLRSLTLLLQPELEVELTQCLA